MSAHTPGTGTIAPMDSSNTRRDATRRKLFEAAVTLIAEQGFSSTTVDEIAERAGVAKGTVYYNFASKNVLFEELLRHGIELLATSLQAAAEEVAGPGRQPDRRAGRDDPGRPGLHLPLPGAHPALRRRTVAHQPGLAVDPDGGARAGHHGGGGRAAGGGGEGELSEEIDIPLTASALFGMVLVAALDWQSYQPDRSIDDVHAALSRLLQGRVSGRPS